MTMAAMSVVLLAVLAQASPPTTSAEEKAKAKGLLAEGSALYRVGDYAGALERFEAAYSSYPSPKLWFNIGQANQHLGRAVAAMEAFERFLSDAMDAPANTRDAAHSSVAELRTKLGQLRIECDAAGAELSIDGKTVGRAPLPGPLWATANHHQIVARHPDFPPGEAKVEVSVGVLATVTIQLAPSATAVLRSEGDATSAPVIPAATPAASPTAFPPPSEPARLAPSPSPVAITSQATGPSLTVTPATAQEPSRPLYRRWWFWSGVGAVVASGVVTGILLGTRSAPRSPSCDVGALCATKN